MKKNFLFNWIFHSTGMVFALFFAGFGIHVLKLSYAMEHPGYFIVFFFTSNFIILLSLTLLIALGFRLYRSLKPHTEESEKTSSGDHSEDGGKKSGKA